jgi:hypothetical protein
VLLKIRRNLRYPLELSPIYTKPPDTKKLSLTPPIFHFLSLRTLQGYNGYINIYICPLYPPFQNYAVLGLSKTTPFWAKRCGFVNFRIFFFFFEKKKELKKKKKKKKKGESRGVAGATPCPEMGWPDHPIFGQGVPNRPYGGGRSHPRPLGVVRPPCKAKKKKKKTEKWVLAFGGGRTTP